MLLLKKISGHTKMKEREIQSIAKEVVKLELDSLKKLHSTIGKSFEQIIKTILNCKNGKVIISGVGKSGIIGKKWSATLSSTGTSSFFLDASNASHGDMGQITSNDIVILLSLSGESSELKNIIQYANRNKILLIGIVSKKNSILYKAADIKLLIPEVKEAGGIVPTASTTTQLALGDALAIAAMQYKKFGKLDFKKLHPAGNLGFQLKTVEDIMVIGNKIPFVKENLKMKKALKVLSEKKLGILIVRNKQRKTIGIITDGQVRRYNENNLNIHLKNVSQIMTKNPISVDKDILAAKALSLMNTKKITSLCVHYKKNKFKTIGVLHVHNILQSNIS